jgi:hypothetical protein
LAVAEISAAWMLAWRLSEKKEETPMALYELRTYTLQVGKMAEAVKLRPPLPCPGILTIGKGETRWQ